VRRETRDGARGTKGGETGDKVYLEIHQNALTFLTEVTDFDV